MQQSQPQMLPMIPSVPPTNITTEQIQKHLDENKRLILAILENQNLGRLAECAQYQAQLQKNLMYLAAIADAQPQAPSMPPQMAPQSVMQPGGQSGQYMQYPQAAMVQQPSGFSPRNPLQFTQEHQRQLQLQQQSMQGPVSMRSGANNGMLAMHNETIMGGGSGTIQQSSAGRSEFVPSGCGGGGNTASGASGGSLDIRVGSKHDVLEVGSGGNGQGKPAAGQRTSDVEYRN